VLTENAALGIDAERAERIDEDELAPNEDDPPDPVPVEATAVACTVWFGAKVPAAAERELLAMLGSHNGVAVMQWPRDADRVQHCRDLGIPTLCFVPDSEQIPPSDNGLVEWLPSCASDDQVHSSLSRLSRFGETQRQAAIPILDHERLHLGACQIHLDSAVCGLAAVLVANFDQAVDDTFLRSVAREPKSSQRSLLRDLLWLDRDVNQIGLEVVPVNNHEHAIRRCGK
jgi:hypothetical protein